MSKLEALNRRRQNLMFRLTGMFCSIRDFQNNQYSTVLYREELEDLKAIQNKLERILRQKKKSWEYVKKTKLNKC